MKKLRVGYWPLSASLKSPGDRRRLIFWAKARGHAIITDLSQKVDVIVASENSDFNSKVFFQRETPVIFDLVDAYLSPLNVYDDIARGLAKKISGQISGRAKPFSKHIKDFCVNSNAVICSSIEQEEIIKNYNANTFIILDSHDEIPFIEPILDRTQTQKARNILWEGQPATIRGIGQISSVLSELSKTGDVHFNFVTDERYFQVLGKYFKKETIKILETEASRFFDCVNIVPWTVNNLVNIARSSSVAMIPIDLLVPMQGLKPENRLLIMWRLGLPCLTSPSFAYTRVGIQAGVNTSCPAPEDWTNSFNRLLSDPIFAYNEVLRGQNYLRENHNRSILLNKWDAVVESVMS